MTVKHIKCYLRNDMLIKNDNIELEFSLPEHMTDVGIRISGGLDSAIILYILCIYITETNRDIKILPMTTNDWTKPYQVKWATRVLNWIQNQFPNVNFYEHKTYQLKENEDYIQGQIDHKLRVLKEFEQLNNKKIDVTLHGQNLAPPKEVTDKFVNSKGHHMAGPNSKDGRNAKQDAWVPEKKLYRPLINLDKQGIAEIYKYYKLTETLFNKTRSCEYLEPDMVERTNNYNSHCETDCWWCAEREWGFGKI